MTVYSLADIFTCIFEAVAMFILFETFLERRDVLNKWIYIVGMFILSGLIIISNLFFNFGIMNAAFISLLALLFSFLYKGQIKIKLLISILGVLFLAIIEIIVLFLLSAFYKTTTTKIVENESFRLLGIIISKMLSFVAINIIRITSKKYNIPLRTSYWCLFILIFAISHLAVFLIFTLSYNIGSTYWNNLSLICSIGLLISTGFTLYLYESLSKQAEVIHNKEQFEQHLKSQVKHLDEVLITQQELKKFKHDLSQHFTVLLNYFEEQDYAAGTKHLKSLTNIIKSDRKTFDTGNIAFDTILNTKKYIAESKGIEFISSIQVPEKIPIDSADICVIVGNALDNSIEACERIEKQEKKIEITAIYDKRSFYFKISNTALEASKMFTTSKKDKKNHGFGLQNIKTALLKYNSEPEITFEDNKFTLKFIIFL